MAHRVGQHQLTDTSGEAERGRGSIYRRRSARGADQVRLRTRATFQSVKMKKNKFPPNRRHGAGYFCGGRLAAQAQLLGAAAAGVQPPKIDCQLAGYGHDGFLALCACGFCAPGEDGNAFLDGRVTGLETDQAPGKFDQGGSQAWVAMFGHAAGEACLSCGGSTRPVRTGCVGSSGLPCAGRRPSCF